MSQLYFDYLKEGWNIRGISLLTIALLFISTELKSWMTHTPKGAHRVDTSMRTLGRASAAFINVYGRGATVKCAHK